MNNSKSFLPVMLVATALFIPNISMAEINPAGPPQGKFYEQYYSMYFGETKCGWAVYSFTRKKNQIIANSTTNMKIGRDTLVMNINVSTQSVETLGGKPISFKSTTNIADSKTIYQGEFIGNKVRMEINQGGQKIEHKYAVPPNTTMAWGDYLKTLKHINTPEASFSLNSFDPTLGPNQIDKINVQVVGPSQTKIAGQTIDGIKLIAESKTLGPYPIISYCDKKAHIITTEMQAGIIKIQMLSTTSKKALENITSEEIFKKTFIQMPAPIKLKQNEPLRLKISSNNDSPLPTFPENAKQKIVERSTNAIVLEILPPRSHWADFKPTPPTKAMLSSSEYVNLNDPLLQKLAKTAKEKATKPKDIARNLSRFVYSYINEKNLATAFASASEVAKTKSGDCSEHAILLAALAQLNDIPTQIVAGLIYTKFDKPNGSFGYHMWNQLWIDDRWVDVDSTFNQEHADQTHVAISTWDLTDKTFINQAIEILPFIGQIKIEQISEKSK